jgi:membrane peptidoglycan carboxypeptidase
MRPVDPRSRGQAGNGHHARGRGQADGYDPGNGRPGNGGPGNDATAFYGGAGQRGPGQRGPSGDQATRVQRVPGGYREAVGRITGPFTGPITDSWRRIGDRVGPGRRGPGGPGGPGGSGPGGKRIKRKGDWWRHWTWRKAIGVVGAAAGLCILAVVGVMFYLYSATSIPTQELASDFVQNSTVYFSDGKTVVGSFGALHRQILTFNQIPKVMQDAALAAEERTYWTDGAISPTGILRAAYDDIFHGDTAGGSTITQEFVRQYYQDIGTQQTASRKIKEIFVAEKLAKAESKQWILTNYLNTIYLGDDAYGVAAAAETYFGIPISKIDIAQAAVIAAIIQEPSEYPLPQYRSNLIARWRNSVLAGLVKMGDLSAQQAATMKFPAMNTNPSGQYAGNEPWDGYIMSEVDNELTEVDHISQSELDTGGLKIVLTVSPQDEQQLYQAVDYNIGQIKAEGLTLPSYALFGAEAQNPANGDILAIYGGPGMNVPKKQCAGTCQLNTTLIGEQVGSSFKPYTVSAAVKEGMNVQTSVLNASPQLWVPPFSMGSTLSSTTPKPASEGYFPVHNDDDETIPGTQANGGTTVQNALAQSSNTAFTDLAHRVGLTQIEQMAESEGGVDPSAFANEEGVGITLGIDSLTVNDQATMVSTIDDDGVYHAAHMVASITQPDGVVTHPQVASHVSLTPAQDSQVQYAMEKTTVDGTATAAAMDDGRPIIGKTGTTSGSKSVFFVGGIPQFDLAVGIWCNQQSSSSSETLTGIGGFGGDWPAAIFHSYTQNMWENLPVLNFLNPQFSGQAWIQVAQLPKKKAAPKKPHNQPTFPGQPGQPGQPGRGHHNGGPTPPISETTAPVATSTSSPPVDTEPASPPESPSSSATVNQGGDNDSTAATQVTSSVREAGVALGGLLSVLPGSLLWVRVSRRRRRRRPGAAR